MENKNIVSKTDRLKPKHNAIPLVEHKHHTKLVETKNHGYMLKFIVNSKVTC